MDLMQQPESISSLSPQDSAVLALNELTCDDPERAHGEADDILLNFIKHVGHPEVAKAYQAVVDRCCYWSTS